MSTMADPMVNGNLPHQINSINEVAEYEKILRLRDEVFAGSHPRLTLPAQALKIVPPPSQLNPPPTLNLSAFLSNSTTGTHASATAATAAPASAASGSNSQPATTGPSEINPILLTKSDDLIRAETQLKRQRLEKALRDQFEQKRLEARKRPAPAEAKPDFDVSALLARALEIAKPVESKDDPSATDSFDENSLYSSRAPDSTPERGELSPSSSQRQMTFQADDIEADRPSGPRVQSAVMGSPLIAASDRDDPPRFQTSIARARPNESTVDLTAMDIDDEEEEGEYSPPEALEHYHSPNNTSSQGLHTTVDPRSRPLRRYSEVDDDARRGLSPSEANGRIVRNHTTSPLAPQPSPSCQCLFTKDSWDLQNGRPRRDRGRYGGSPEPGQQYPPKKKRKMDRKSDRRSRRNGLSPDAFIKEENVSPPPFHDVQPLGSRIRPSAPDRPIVIDDGPVPEVRYAANDNRYMSSPARPINSQLGPAMPLSEPRVVSTTALRPQRDDQDLRRVASMHSIRREQPRDFREQTYESPGRSRPLYREASPVTREQPRAEREDYDRADLQEMRIARTPSTIYREVYPPEEVQYRQAVMAAPQLERIVVDQYGRKFREIIESEQAIRTPRAMSVRPTEPEMSRYDTYRGSRAGSVFAEPPAEKRSMQEMPPPMTYRQVVENPRASVVPLATPLRDSFDHGAGRSGSVQVIDRATGRPIFIDDRPEFPEPVRMTSVRPSMTRYAEAPQETFIRGQTARASGRESSILMEERVQPRREYVPVDDPRYEMVEPTPRYYDAQGREVILEGARNQRPRVVQRY